MVSGSIVAQPTTCESWKISRDAFAQRQLAVGLFFDLEKTYETIWQYGIIRDFHRIGLRGRLPVLVSEYLRDRWISQNWDHTLWQILPRGGCSNWWCPDCVKILKEILNKIWTSADFPHQWRAATVIPIPKPNKDHTGLLSYRPIALTSCLCKVLEQMINTRLIWYLEKSGILDRSQCGFRKHRSTTDHLWVLKDISGMRLHKGSWQSVSQDWPQRQTACFCLRISQGPPNQSQNWDHTLWRILHRGGCSNWWCPGCDMFWTEDQWTALLHCHFQSTICWRPVNLFSWALPGHHRHLRQAVNSIQGMVLGLHSPQVQSHTFHCIPSEDSEPPPVRIGIGNAPLPVEESTKFLGLWWDSHLSFENTSVC